MPSTPTIPSLLVAGAQHPKTLLYADFLNGATHWRQVQNKIQALPTPQEKGDAFEAIMAALIVTDPTKQIRQAWFPAGQAPSGLWKRLGLPSSQEDRGIDGLAVDANGNIIAIQFKFRSDTAQVLHWSNDKLGNFFGMSNAANVAWLVSNVEAVHDLGQRHEHAITTLLPDLQKIPATRLADAWAWMQGQAITFQRKTERADQLRALDAIDRAFRGEVVQTFADADMPGGTDFEATLSDQDEAPEDLEIDDDRESVAHAPPTAVAHNRVTVVSACGTGKTLIAERAVERSVAQGGRNFVVFVPSISLIDQTVDAWTREWAGDPTLAARMRYLAVCSDETVGDTQDDRSTMRVNELGIPSVTTHAHDLERFLASSAGTDDVRVVFATYQSSEVVQEATRALQTAQPGWSFDLGVLDEAHKTAVKTAGKLAKHQMFSRPLHDEAIPIRQRIAMTATPRVRRVAAKDGDEAGVAYSMDNVDLYGPIVHRYTFHEAVQDKVIAPYKVVVSMVSHDEAQAAQVTVRGQDGRERQLSLEEAVNRLAVAKAIQTTGAQRVLTFHSTIKDAERFADRLEGVGGVLEQLGHDEQDALLQGWDTQSIQGADSVARRETILQGLRDHGKSLRSNARVLIEGLDVPAVDMVAFLGRQASPTDIVQAVGRAARSHAGKQEGYVVVPVVYAQDQSLDEALATAQDRDDGMGTLFTLLSALMDHDQDLTRVINDLQTARVSGNPEAVERAMRAFGQRVGVVNRRSSRDVGRSMDALGMGLHDLSEKLAQRVVERLADGFAVGLGHLDRFIDEHQHANVPTNYPKIQGFSLGSWLDTRRQDYKKGRLSEERIAALNARKISWDPMDDLFSEGLQALDRFIEEHQHANVPHNYPKIHGFSLGSWLTNRRRDYKKGRLSEERIAALNTRKISWEPKDDLFSEGLQALDRFIEEHQHANVPQNYPKIQGFSLGKWLNNRRQEYKKGRLSDDRIAALNARTISWERMDDLFSEGLKALDGFIEKHQHANIPRDYPKTHGFSLVTWLDSRRRDYKKGRLSEERIAALNARKISWEPKDDLFSEGLQALDRFIEEHQHANVPHNYPKIHGFSLGPWLTKRRGDYKKGRLSEERIAALNARKISWDPKDDLFSEGLTALDRFIEEHQHVNVPRDYPKIQGISLGVWLDHRRQEHKKGRLSEDRIAALNARDPSWATDDRRKTPVRSVAVVASTEGTFLQYLAPLTTYQAVHGGLNVPADHRTDDGLMLGAWLRQQCQAMRAGTLPDQEKAVLVAMGVHADLFKPLVEQVVVSDARPLVAPQDELDELMDVARAPTKPRRRLGT